MVEQRVSPEEVEEVIGYQLIAKTQVVQWSRHDERYLNLARDLRDARDQLEAAANRADRLETALMAIQALDPEKDSPEGLNEWGESDMFNKAQEIAEQALDGEPRYARSDVALGEIRILIALHQSKWGMVGRDANADALIARIDAEARAALTEEPQEAHGE